MRPSQAEHARLLDAVSTGLAMLQMRGGGERQSLLIIGQSRDRGSETRLADLLVRLNRSGVTVYEMTYSAFLTAFTTKASEYQPPKDGAADYLGAIRDAARLTTANTVAALAKATGGQQTSFETKAKLENKLIALGRDIHSRYLVGFTPAREAVPKFHTLELRIRGRDDVRVRVTPGYWAVSPTQ